MELKTKQQIETQVKNYLEKTSRHLFVTESGYLYKIVPLYKDNKTYYATIMVGNGQLLINVKEAVTDSQYTWYGNNTAHVIKRNVFPEYYKAKSIPYFKRMRDFLDEMNPQIKLDNKANQELAEKFKDKIANLELIKEQ